MTGISSENGRRWSIRYARIALGAAFLSAVAARFGIWDGTGFRHFPKFLAYTAEVNSFMPASAIPFLARAATVLETTFGVLLILGLWPRWVALGSSVLLAIFGTAMAISFGPKEPLDYSVFSASAAALMVAFHSSCVRSEPTV
jgi:uncharacterized membrane protein YphA (DoxX/SURF4 family)